ncbi:MAG: ribonuclease H family protein [Sulfuricurvum sp.]|nr:ribonuclease H family protein [Sulfuricurvum sp.]MDP3022773.1 ribonuclease H family protein [Sulfuricurvum sp.]
MADKFYVVKKGRTPGIYTTWAECLRQVDKFAGAVYKSYISLEEAQEAFESNTLTPKSPSPKIPPKKRTSVTSNNDSSSLSTDDIRLRIYCDGACSGNPGKAGSGLAIYEDNNKPILLYGAADAIGTNNTAELKALLKALELAVDTQHDKVAILSDSKYSIECVVNWAYGWKAKGWTKQGGEIKNLEIIQTAHAIYDGIKNKVVISHVRGHAGVEGNELADRMAVMAASKGNSTFMEYTYESIDHVIALSAG